MQTGENFIIEARILYHSNQCRISPTLPPPKMLTGAPHGDL